MSTTITKTEATQRRYQCSRCKHPITLTTNHDGPVESNGSYARCPICPPCIGETTWDCLGAKDENTRRSM